MASTFVLHMHLSLSLLMSLLTGCTTESSSFNTAVNETSIESSGIEQKLADGEWTCCARSRKGMILRANQCSKVIFEIDNKGQYILPSGQQTVFNWELYNDSCIKVSSNKSIEEGAYQTKFTCKPEYMELQLIHANLDLIYFLGR